MKKIVTGPEFYFENKSLRDRLMSKLFVIENKNFTRNFTSIDQELQENEVEATECHVYVEWGCRSI